MKMLTSLMLFSALFLVLSSPSMSATKRFDNAALSVGEVTATSTYILFEAAQKTEIKSIKLVDASAIAASSTDFLTFQAERDGGLVGLQVDSQAGLGAYAALSLDLVGATGTPLILEKGEVLSVRMGNSTGVASTTQATYLMNYRLIGNE